MVPFPPERGGRERGRGSSPLWRGGRRPGWFIQSKFTSLYLNILLSNHLPLRGLLQRRRTIKNMMVGEEAHHHIRTQFKTTFFFFIHTPMVFFQYHSLVKLCNYYTPGAITVHSSAVCAGTVVVSPVPGSVTDSAGTHDETNAQ